MPLLLLALLQLGLCMMSMGYLLIGEWARGYPWYLLFPGVFTCIWVYVTLQLVKAANNKMLVICLSVFELPFVTAWPAWAFVFIFFFHPGN